MLLNIIFTLIAIMGVILSAVGARSLKLNEESLTTFRALPRTIYTVQRIDLLEREVRFNLVMIAFGIMFTVGSIVMMVLNN